MRKIKMFYGNNFNQVEKEVVEFMEQNSVGLIDIKQSESPNNLTLTLIYEELTASYEPIPSSSKQFNR